MQNLIKSSQKVLTTKDVVDFITKNRASKIFIDYSIPDILDEVNEAVNNGTILVSTNDTNTEIDGILMFELDCRYKILFVNHLLCTSKRAVKNYIRWFHTNFNPAEWSIQANRRHQGLVRYKDTIKLLKKLWATPQAQKNLQVS